MTSQNTDSTHGEDEMEIETPSDSLSNPPMVRPSTDSHRSHIPLLPSLVPTDSVQRESRSVYAHETPPRSPIDRYPQTYRTHPQRAGSPQPYGHDYLRRPPEHPSRQELSRDPYDDRRYVERHSDRRSYYYRHEYDMSPQHRPESAMTADRSPTESRHDYHPSREAARDYPYQPLLHSRYLRDRSPRSHRYPHFADIEYSRSA